MSQSQYLNSSASDVARSGFSSWNLQAAAFVPSSLEVLRQEYTIPNAFMMDPRVSDFTPDSLGFSPASTESVGGRSINDVLSTARDIFEDSFENSEPTIEPPEGVQHLSDIPFFELDQSGGLRAPTKKKRALANSGATNPHITKTKSKKPASTKPSKKAVARAEDLLAASIAEKQRLAGEVIKQQEGESEEAKRLGQEIRIVTIDGCPEIEGIYWRAPENDNSIPKTPAAKKVCFDQVYAAILDTTACKEVTTKKAFKSRWGPEKTHYLEGDLVRVGWKVVVRFCPLAAPPYVQRLTRTIESSCRNPRGRLDRGDQRSRSSQLYSVDHVLYVQGPSGWSCQAPHGKSAHFRTRYTSFYSCLLFS